jgi:hypothetical protein
MAEAGNETVIAKPPDVPERYVAQLLLRIK